MHRLRTIRKFRGSNSNVSLWSVVVLILFALAFFTVEEASIASGDLTPIVESFLESSNEYDFSSFLESVHRE